MLERVHYLHKQRGWPRTGGDGRARTPEHLKESRNGVDDDDDDKYLPENQRSSLRPHARPPAPACIPVRCRRPTWSLALPPHSPARSSLYRSSFHRRCRLLLSLLPSLVPGGSPFAFCRRHSPVSATDRVYVPQTCDRFELGVPWPVTRAQWWVKFKIVECPSSFTQQGIMDGKSCLPI